MYGPTLRPAPTPLQQQAAWIHLYRKHLERQRQQPVGLECAAKEWISRYAKAWYERHKRLVAN